MSRNQTTALLALAIGYFAVGAISLSVVGLIAPISQAFQIEASQVGFLVTIFALAFAIVAPLSQLTVGHLPRKTLLMAGLILLAFGSVLSATSPSFQILVIARIIAAIGAALFGPVASASGSQIVGPERQAQALAIVFGGMTVASVLGVPLTSLLGEWFGWQAALGVVALIAGIALMAVQFTVPALPSATHPSATTYGRVLSTPGMLPTIGLTLLQMASQFAIYALASLYITQHFQSSSTFISLSLLAFGVLGVVGNAYAAQHADRIGTSRTVNISLAGLALSYLLLLTLPPHPMVGLVLFAIWAFFGQLFQAPQQSRVVNLSPDQRGLALALNASALYLGISLGSLLGSALLPMIGISQLPIISLTLILLGGAVVRWSKSNPRHAVHQ
jgi:MFS transporter, DHA1 family, inner membrane transport protein